VNIQSKPQPLQIDIQGVQSIRKEAAGEVITGEPGDINTVMEPMKTVPRPIAIKDAGTRFSHELPARSVSVIRLKTR
jgi:alpha-L-arabinofuranosidase